MNYLKNHLRKLDDSFYMWINVSRETFIIKYYIDYYAEFHKKND